MKKVVGIIIGMCASAIAFGEPRGRTPQSVIPINHAHIHVKNSIIDDSLLVLNETKTHDLVVERDAFINSLEAGEIDADGLNADITNTNELNVVNNLTVGGSTTTTDLHVTNNVDIDNNVNVDGDITVGDDLTVAGDTSTTNLTVTNNATINNDLTINGDTTTTNLHVTNDVDIDNNLNVDGDAVIGDDLDVNGDLDVDGDTTLNQLTVETDLDTTGDLFVNGNLYVRDTTPTQGIIAKYVGTPAAFTSLPFLSNPGVENTFVGADAGNIVLTGVSNVAVGTQALTNISMGNNNVAIGVRALENQTIGDNNIAIGQYALQNNILGLANIGIGTQALVTTTGSSNIGLGSGAGFFLTSGIENIIIGTGAGANLTNENNNIIISHSGLVGQSNSIHLGGTSHTTNYQGGIFGSTAGLTDTSVVSIDSNGQLGTGIIYNNINITNSTAIQGNILKNGVLFIGNPGSNNTFVGLDAGDLAVTGTSNVAVGSNALEDVTAGSNNVAVGDQALANNTNGSNNIAVGFRALFQANGNLNTVIGTDAGFFVTTGSDNILIGRGSGSSITTQNNNILIANGGAIGQSNSIHIGSNIVHTTNYQAGIFGVTPGVADTSIVSIDSNGQLGTGIIYNNINIIDSTATQGNILKNGVPFLTNPGTNNLFLGINAGNLPPTLTGTANTGIGNNALTAISSGIGNAALGQNAGDSIDIGLFNLAIGNNALQSVSSGSFNVGIGVNAGSNLTTESNNICIGSSGTGGVNGSIQIGVFGIHTSNYQQGIWGQPYDIMSGTPVSIGVDGQLGTTPSSITYKENITPITQEKIDAFAQLNPVQFTYKTDPTHKIQYGFIAEQVNPSFPELIVRDGQGNVYTIQYQLLHALLHQWMKDMHTEQNNHSGLITQLFTLLQQLLATVNQQLTPVVNQLVSTVDTLTDEVADLTTTVTQLTGQVDDLTDTVNTLTTTVADQAATILAQANRLALIEILLGINI